jgi:hypothetical protein
MGNRTSDTPGPDRFSLRAAQDGLRLAADLLEGEVCSTATQSEFGCPQWRNRGREQSLLLSEYLEVRVIRPVQGNK